VLKWWAERKAQLELEVRALYLAAKDPRTPWHAKALVGLVVAYALSPIDLIPDFIPVLGLLDDLALVPLGVLVARRMIPAEVMAECRERAAAAAARAPRSWIWTWVVVIVAIWLLVAVAVVGLVLWLMSRRAPMR
jgi:uncharacterized membrane protein YkvA (DUF1232 family)